MTQEEPMDMNWDPSKWDWAAGSGQSSSADGLDDAFDDLDDDEDDGCIHPWHDLDFLDGLGDPALMGGIGCSTCGQVWEAGNPDAVSTVWNAAKLALVTSFTRMAAIEEMISAKMDMARCAVCGKWDDRSLLIDMGPRYACGKHVAESIGDPSDDAIPLLRALEWARSAGLIGSEDPALRVRWERMIAASPELAAAAEDDDAQAGLETFVDLGEAASALGLAPRSSLHSIGLAVAQRCDLDPPSSRLASGYLLALVNVARSIHDGATGRSDDAIDHAIDGALPWDDELCVSIAVELCFPGVPEGVEFHGDMADEALRLSSRRVVEGLLARWSR